MAKWQKKPVGTIWLQFLVFLFHRNSLKVKKTLHLKQGKPLDFLLWFVFNEKMAAEY